MMMNLLGCLFYLNLLPAFYLLLNSCSVDLLVAVDWLVRAPRGCLLEGTGSGERCVVARGRDVSRRPVLFVEDSVAKLCPFFHDESSFEKREKKIMKHIKKKKNPVRPIDYRYEDGRLPVSASCVTI